MKEIKFVSITEDGVITVKETVIKHYEIRDGKLVELKEEDEDED